MVYTQEEKANMDLLVSAFQSYLDTKENYDLLYSKKAGYLWIHFHSGKDDLCFQVRSYNELLRSIIGEYLLDEEQRVGHYLKRDYDHVRRLLLPRLEGLGALSQQAIQTMEEEFDACRARCEQMRQEHLEEIHHLEQLLARYRAAI